MDAKNRRKQLADQYWKDEVLFTGDESGWFKVPRSFPLALALLADKRLKGGENVAAVYLELLSHHYGEGVIEMRHEAEHAYAAGYTSARAVRTWKERMASLEKLGFIKIHRDALRHFKQVALVHPTVAIERLNDSGLVLPEWWDAYKSRQREAKEPTYKELVKGRSPKVVAMPRKSARAAGGKP
jgi:hypothetical protein